MELTPRIQINGQLRVNAQNQIIEKSILLNIREENLFRAVQLFNQLDAKINGANSFLLAPQSEEENIPVVEEEPKSYNWPFESNEPVPQCPECSSRMVKRNGARGQFWGCSKFKNGCKGTRQI